MFPKKNSARELSMARFRSLRHAFTVVELLVVITIVSLLIAILLPAVQAARESGRRSQCANNLKQAALGLIGFQNAKGYFPGTGSAATGYQPGAASTTSSGSTITPPQEGVSWMTLVLPLLDNQPIYDKYDQTQSWSSTQVASSALILSNSQVVANRLGVAECPSAPYATTHLDGDPALCAWTAIAAPTDYGATTQVEARLAAYTDSSGATIIDGAGPGIMALGNPKNTIDQVKDGMSNTILLAECAGRPQLYRQRTAIGAPNAALVNGGGWCRPASDFSLDGASVDGATLPGPCGVNCTNGEDIGSQPYPYPTYGANGSGEIYSFHQVGANVAFGDGAVAYVNSNIDIRVLAADYPRRREIASRTDLEVRQ